MEGELIWAFDEPQVIGSVFRPKGTTTSWFESDEPVPNVPKRILREATRQEWHADGGFTYYTGPLFFYAIAVD